MEKEELSVLSVRIPRDLKKKLEDLAWRDRRSLTQYLIIKFEEMVKEDGN